MSVEKLRKAEIGLTALLVGLFPLIFLPIFPNPFSTPKLVLSALLLSLLFVVKAAKNVLRKEKGLIFSTSAFDIPVFLIALSYFLSGWIVSPNRMEAFWLPGTVSFVIAGALIYFLINQLSEGGKNAVKTALLISGAILSFFAIISVSGVLKSANALPAVLRLETFSPSGSILTLVIFIVVLVPFAADMFRLGKSSASKSVYGVFLALFALAGIAGAFTLFRNWSVTQLPSASVSWAVATEALKERAFLGAGPGNYLTAFSRFAPISFNQTDAWNLRYANANSFLLTTVTEVGLLGLAALVVLAIAVVRKARVYFKDGKAVHVLPVVMLVAFLAFFPATPTLIFLLFVLLALGSRTYVVHMFTRETEDGNASIEGKVATFAIAIPTVILSIGALVLVFQATRGEYLYYSALQAITRNDGRVAYETMGRAISVSPYADRYRISYAQLNLALANSLAQKEGITEEERTNVGRLVQQAIREGRSAVLLNRQRAGNWESLATIYRSVMPIARGADQFAVQTYSQAIALDPVNPNIRLALGGIFYGARRYEEAIDVFRLAVLAKPDLANSRYNLAIAYRDNGQFDRALAELTQALTLVQSGTQDHDIIKKEIENVQSKVPARNKQAASGENVKAPEVATDTAKINPPVELPEDTTPPTLDEEVNQ